MKVEPAGGSPPRYLAFLSYQHRKAQWATALQGEIEPIVPRTLGSDRERFQLFRDEDELAASADLFASLRRALLDSESLIGVWTDTALGSPVMLREISEFSRCCPERPLLILPVGLEHSRVREEFQREFGFQPQIGRASCRERV